MAHDIFGCAVLDDVEAIGFNHYVTAVLEYQPFTSWSQIRDVPLRSSLIYSLLLDYEISTGQTLTDLIFSTSPESISEERGTLYLKAVRAWGSGDLENAYSQYMVIIQRYPSDFFAVKRAQLMGLMIGKPSLILAPSEVVSRNKRDGYFYGMHAFALEQIGDMQGARSIAREGWEKGFSDPWLLHAIVHIEHHAQNWDAAEKMLRSHLPLFTKNNLHIFLYTHFWWHLCVVILEKESSTAASIVEVQDIIQHRLWDDLSDSEKLDPQVQINLLGSLWRISSMCSRFVQERVGELKSLFTPHVDPFLDVLYIRFLDATEGSFFLESMTTHAIGKRSELSAAAKIAHHVLLITSTVDSEAAKRALREVANWECLGNSWEQRDVLWVLLK